MLVKNLIFITFQHLFNSHFSLLSKVLFPEFQFYTSRQLYLAAQFNPSCTNATDQYCHTSPSQSSPSQSQEPFSLNLSLTLEGRGGIDTSSSELADFQLLPAVYIALTATTLLGQVKCLCTQEVPLLNISNNELLHYILKRNYSI